MSMTIIMIFIVILNVVAIALTYYCLENMDNKEKIVFIAVGMAVIYVLTSFVYWISTKDMGAQDIVKQSKDLIIYMFVPVNTILVLPILAKSYRRYKSGRLKTNQLRNRIVLLAIFLFIILIIECSYFKDVQANIINIIEKSQEEKQQETAYSSNTEIEQNSIVESNEVINSNEITNETTNQTTNQIDSNIINNINNVDEENILENINSGNENVINVSINTID